MPNLSGLTGKIGSVGKTVGRSAAGFAGYSRGAGFSTMGKFRMGLTAGALGAAAMHQNSKRGGYRPKSSATGGLQPRSSGGMGASESGFV